MKILTHILAGSAPVIALVMALQLDAQADLISAQKDYISKLEEVVEDFYKMFELEYGKSG